MRSLAMVGVLTSLVFLVGCAAQPSHHELTERFRLELEAASGIEGIWDEIAGGVADDALAGNCGSKPYRAGLSDPTLQYAWDVTCLMYYEDSYTDMEAQAIRDAVAKRAIETIDIP